MVFIRKVMSRGYEYAQLVRTERINGKVRTKMIRHLGPWKSLAEKFIHPTEETKFISYDYGEIKVLYELSKELKLVEILNKFTAKGGGINVGELSVVIIINHCINPRSKSKIKRWFRRTYLPQLMKVPPDKANKDALTTALDYLTEERINNIESALVKQLEKLFKLKKECLMYDITSTYVYGDTCDLAEYGYNRDHVPQRQINFGLVVSKDGKFPLMHKIFPGNTVDVTTVQKVSSEIKERLQIPDNSCMLILDRGMVSVKNLEHLDGQRFGYIVGLSKSNNDTIDLIKEAKDFVEIDIEAEISASERILLHNKKKKKFVVFLNKKIKEKEQKKRNKAIEKIKNKLEKLSKNTGKGKYKDRNNLIMRVGEITQGVRKYFNLKIDKKLSRFNFSVNENAVQNQEFFDGKYVVCSTDINMSALEIWNAYNDKDKAEKAFRCIKSFIKVRPIRHWKSNRVKAHIFLCILAYLLQKVLEYKLQKFNISAQEIIDKMCDIKLISYNLDTTKFEKITKITDEQKLILKNLTIWPI